MPDPIRVLLLSALALAGLTACSERGGDGAGQPLAGGLKEREVPRVRTAPVLRTEMVRTISTTEPLTSEREIKVFPRVTGVVASVLVEEGARVATGDVLCVLDQAQALAAVADASVALREAEDRKPKLEVGVRQAAERIARAKLTHEQAEAEFARNENAGLIARNDLEKLRLARDQAFRDWQAEMLAEESAQTDLVAIDTTIERAQLALEKEQLSLAWTEVRAPFDGVIAERSVEVGDAVSSGASLFVLTDTDRVRVIVHRPQRELTFFRAAGARASAPIEIAAFPDALPGESYAGKIRIVSPTIDPTSGSFRLTIDLEQPPEDSARPRLLPGMLVRLEVIVERHPDALVVPKRALRREGDRRFLFTVCDGQARRVDVAEGFTDDESIEVVPARPEDLAPGEPVVVVGNRDLEDGDEVEAEDWRTEPGGPAPVAPSAEETAQATDEVPAADDAGETVADQPEGSAPAQADDEG
jgi:membrane fusion protein (multidrug efflux system)